MVVERGVVRKLPSCIQRENSLSAFSTRFQGRMYRGQSSGTGATRPESLSSWWRAKGMLGVEYGGSGSGGRKGGGSVVGWVMELAVCTDMSMEGGHVGHDSRKAWRA